MLDLDWKQLEPGLRKGCPNAWAKAVNEMGPKLIGFASKNFGLSYEQAEDTVQVSLTYTFRYVTADKPVSNWNGLFYEMVRRECLKALRELRKLPPSVSLDSSRDNANPDGSSWANDLPDQKAECPDDIVERQELLSMQELLPQKLLSMVKDLPEEYRQVLLLQKLLSMVEDLPEEYRQVLLMRFYDGLNYREIKDLLSIALGTVCNRVNRGIRLLKEQLDSG